MLQALLTDAAALDNLQVSVVLCEAAVRMLDDLPDGVTIHQSTAQDDPLSALQDAGSQADLILPIAPECDDLLCHVSDAIESLSCVTLLPAPDILQLCSDKFRTWQEFHSNAIPMLECRPVAAGAVATDDCDPAVILKPRLGAGCDGIQRGSLPPEANPQDYLQQPWIEARSLSVGIAGGVCGVHRLPPADQQIVWDGPVPEYQGGRIPASLSTQVAQRIDGIVDAVLGRIGAFRGYLGLDFLVAVDDEVYLNEINPRVCTSYVGYRRCLSTNLLGLMTGCETAESDVHCVQPVSFEATGAVVQSATQTSTAT